MFKLSAHLSYRVCGKFWCTKRPQVSALVAIHEASVRLSLATHLLVIVIVQLVLQGRRYHCIAHWVTQGSQSTYGTKVVERLRSVLGALLNVEFRIKPCCCPYGPSPLALIQTYAMKRAAKVVKERWAGEVGHVYYRQWLLWDLVGSGCAGKLIRKNPECVGKHYCGTWRSRVSHVAWYF